MINHDFFFKYVQLNYLVSKKNFINYRNKKKSLSPMSTHIFIRICSTSDLNFLKFLYNFYYCIILFLILLRFQNYNYINIFDVYPSSNLVFFKLFCFTKYFESKIIFAKLKISKIF